MARVLGAMEPDWRAAVGVREEPELERALVDRLPPPAAPRPVSVTDLVGPRRAFWREFSPVPMDPERQRRVDLGRSIHRRLGAALAGEGALEVRVRSEGVVGRIDLLSDVPVEVKTSASSVGVEHLHSARPDQIEQLAIYCLLARRNSGRLVTVVVADGAPESVQAVDIDMADTEAVRAEVVARASALRQAWVRGQPHGLPACRWFGRGCEFQEAAVCDCASDNPAPSSAIVAAVRAIVERKDVSARIEARLRGVSDPERPRTVNRFRDLLYPRRAYYERTAVKPSPERPHRSPVGPLDLYGRVSAALEGGPLGEVARLVPRSEELEEEVNGYRGVPFLLRISRGQGRASAGSIVERQPQYALELGFRCVTTGSSSAYLVLGRERAERDADRLQVFGFRFEPTTVFARLWRERSARLAAALRDQSPRGLPRCPEWMFADCPYRSECACGATGSRSQR